MLVREDMSLVTEDMVLFNKKVNMLQPSVAAALVSPTNGLVGHTCRLPRAKLLK